MVLSPHLDQVGVGEPINRDKIYDGAMDDASGVSLIEIANMLKRQRPGRDTRVPLDLGAKAAVELE